MHPDWLIPQWPAPARVQAVCTSRQGGFSQPPYDSLNLGLHVGDDPQQVMRNRAHLQASLATPVPYLAQVHGTQVLQLDRQTADGVEADACYTTMSGLTCCIMVADCLPVLFTDRQGSFVAAAHAGWRGLAGQGGVGVLEALVRALPVDRTDDLLAWLGPCIGPQAFEVGPQVRAAFVANAIAAQVCFKPSLAPDKYLADLPGLARQRLSALGVGQIFGNDGSQPWCTVSNPSRFFSHRRDRISGRMAACIWMN